MQKFNEVVNLFPGKLYLPHLLLSEVSCEHGFEDRRPCSKNLQSDKMNRSFNWHNYFFIKNVSLWGPFTRDETILFS